MKTNKVLKAINWGETIHISDNYLFSATINHSGDFNKGLPSENDSKNAALIVASVNACKAINQYYPLKVAEVLPDMVKFIKEFINPKSGTLKELQEHNNKMLLTASMIYNKITTNDFEETKQAFEK